jgi:hypothetical protein
MRLTLLGGLVLACCVQTSAARAADGSRQKGEPMATWQTSADWRHYKAYWNEIPQSASPAGLEAISKELAKLNLDRVFPNPELVTSLSASLDDRVTARSEILDRSIWRDDKRVGEKRFPYDRSAELAASVRMLDHDTGALRGLRKLQITDPWVSEVLVPAVERGCGIVESQLTAGEKQPEAQTALENARAVLAKEHKGH